MFRRIGEHSESLLRAFLESSWQALSDWRSLNLLCLVIIFDSIPAQSPGARPRPVSVRVSPNFDECPEIHLEISIPAPDNTQAALLTQCAGDGPDDMGSSTQ